MGHFTIKMSLRNINDVVSWVLLQNEHNFQIRDVFEKTNKLPVLFLYKSMVKPHQGIIIAETFSSFQKDIRS